MGTTVWKKLSEEERQSVHVFADEYRAFLTNGKTEREYVNESVQYAEEHGFRELSTFSELKPGDKVYATNKNKNIVLFIIGTKPLVGGLNILGAHIDSPHIDLKPNPLYEKDGFALMDTHYYGGIKKYQWVARPMALHGVVVKKDGTKVDIVFGEDENDPVVGISDLLIHLSQAQMAKPGSTVVEGENLDVTVGSIPSEAEKDPIKDTILTLLKERYGIEEEDFHSAEIQVLPAGPARNYGLDNSMIIGYGQDDRVCAYTSMRALMDVEHPERTSCCILVDKEEIGSVGATGMQSAWFENVVAKMLHICGCTSYMDLRETLQNSKMLSSDVSSGYDPLYAEVSDKKNSAALGHGIVFLKYTGRGGKSGSNDATAEFVAEVRNAMAIDNVTYQTAELGKVDVGGGGTIAYITANMNMDVVDAGIPVFNMHAPAEVTSKADVYEAYRGYMAFLKNVK